MTRGRSVSGKGSIQGKSNPGIVLRQPCRYYLKSTCTRSPCEYWHPRECQIYITETGCKAGDKCLFPHHVDEQPNKKSQRKATIPTKDEKRRQECCGQCENCISDGSRLARLGCTGFSERKTASHSVLRHVKQVSGKQKTIAWKNTSQKILIREVPTR